MTAVMLPAVSVIPMWFVVVGVILAAGAAPLATWAARALRSQLARRFLLALAFAIILSLTLGVSTVYAVSVKCDWYDVLFWLCG